MRSIRAHNQLPARRFLQRFKAAFTTRADCSTWPNVDRTWKHADQYFRGLLRPGRHKTITGLATRMNAHQECLERFVRESPWESEAVEAHLRNAIPGAFQARDAALIVDGMGIPKKGDYSVGVYQQWCGATGKLDNCQVTVNCTLARPGQDHNSGTITWPLSMQLYLPEKWTGEDDSVYDDPAEQADYARRREKAEIPEEVGYQPKYGIAIDQIEAAIEAGIEHACVIADTNYGMRSTFRKQLRSLNEPYVLDIETDRLYVVPEDSEILEPGRTPGPGAPRKHRTIPDEVEMETAVGVAERVSDDAWTYVVWNEGTKESLAGSFYRERIQVVSNASHRRVEDETGWLLLQRDHGPEEELKAWICWGLDDMSLEELVTWAHLRWSIEQFHKQIKQLLGADEFQGRTWQGFQHHLAVVMLAHAFIAEQRLETGEEYGEFTSFEEVARQLVRVAAIHRLVEEHGFDRETAEAVGVDMLRGFSEWG